MPNQHSTEILSTQTASSFFSLSVSPGKVIRGAGILSSVALEVANLGSRPLIVAGNHTLNLSQESLKPLFQCPELHPVLVSYGFT
jgi:glycerol dehydrogenase-like iron-containing ADH family enzyme